MWSQHHYASCGLSRRLRLDAAASGAFTSLIRLSHSSRSSVAPVSLRRRHILPWPTRPGVVWTPFGPSHLSPLCPAYWPPLGHPRLGVWAPAVPSAPARPGLAVVGPAPMLASRTTWVPGRPHPSRHPSSWTRFARACACVHVCYCFHCWRGQGHVPLDRGLTFDKGSLKGCSGEGVGPTQPAVLGGSRRGLVRSGSAGVL